MFWYCHRKNRNLWMWFSILLYIYFHQDFSKICQILYFVHFFRHVTLVTSVKFKAKQCFHARNLWSCYRCDVFTIRRKLFCPGRGEITLKYYLLLRLIARATFIEVLFWMTLIVNNHKNSITYLASVLSLIFYTSFTWLQLYFVHLRICKSLNFKQKLAK